MSNITILTFVWGDWCADFQHEYIRKLRSGLQRNTSVKFDFIVMTDDLNKVPLGYDYIQFTSKTWKGCLPKINAFNPAHHFQNQVFVFDLDTVIVRNMDDILSYSGEFCVRAQFTDHRVIDGDLVSFKPEFGAINVWEPFVNNIANVELMTNGRERYWYRSLEVIPDLWQKLYPGQYLSYKNHCRNGLPEGGRLVSFHGDPRPHVLNEKWVKENWK